MIPHALHGDEDPDEGEYLPFDMGAPRTASLTKRVRVKSLGRISAP
jgi:hypothetical protein